MTIATVTWARTSRSFTGSDAAEVAHAFAAAIRRQFPSLVAVTVRVVKGAGR